MSPWPNPLDYNEAIQNPRMNFSDVELQQGKPQLNKFGLPVPHSGSFATVYKFACGTRDVAVRCFLNHYPDQEKRYAEISRHLQMAKLPYMVQFEFQKQGIKVNGSWYPILKMEWIKGDRLDVYVFNNLNNGAVLRSLAQRWLAMSTQLRTSQIAHGDFQHGNIIIVNGNIKLIDYDGMFVPSLRGQKSHEIGHRNYQHPRRSGIHYDSYLDNFSAWVIYASLVAFSIEPMLWAQVQAGDESLLLSAKDYQNTNGSAAFNILRRHAHPHVRWLAEQLIKLPLLGVNDVPILSDPNQLAPPTSTPWWKSATNGSVDASADRCPVCKNLLQLRQLPNGLASYLQCTGSGCRYRRDQVDQLLPERKVQPSAASSAITAPGGAAVFLNPNAISHSPSASSHVQTQPHSILSTPVTASPAPLKKPRSSTTTKKRKTSVAVKSKVCPRCGSPMAEVQLTNAIWMCKAYPACPHSEPV
jgi:ssDNA-binding Zn-finger/Zn-ribbon topoisomerase 1